MAEASTNPMGDLLEQHGLSAAEVKFIFDQVETSKKVQKDVANLISGRAALVDLFKKTDFLENLRDKGCTDDIKKMVQDAWTLGDDASTDFIKGIPGCIKEGDLSKTQEALSKHADGLFEKKAEELANVNNVFEGIKILVHFAQLMKIAEDFKGNADTVKHIRKDLKRFRTRHVQRVKTMLEGGARLTAEELEVAQEDFNGLLERLKSAATTATNTRRASGLLAFSSLLELGTTILSVGRTWSVLTRGTQGGVALKAVCQGGLSLSATYFTYLANVQLEDINKLIRKIDSYIANVAQAQRMLVATEEMLVATEYVVMSGAS